MKCFPKIDWRIWLFIAFFAIGFIGLSLKYWMGLRDMPLFKAVCDGDIENAKIAIDAGASVHMPFRDGSTLLHVLAIHTDDIELADYLIHQGISPNAINYSGDSAADEARRAGHLKLAEYLSDRMKDK